MRGRRGRLPLLAEDFRLTSQQVLDDFVGKHAFLHYMIGTFDTMRRAGVLPRADLPHLPSHGHDETVLIWQGEAPDPLAPSMPTWSTAGSPP